MPAFCVEELESFADWGVATFIIVYPWLAMAEFDFGEFDDVFGLDAPSATFPVQNPAGNRSSAVVLPQPSAYPQNTTQPHSRPQKSLRFRHGHSFTADHLTTTCIACDF
jgi:hypothetical protein